MKLRKIFSAVLAAVMCCGMLCAGTVSAANSADAKTDTSFYQDAKALSGAKCYSSLMKVARKYYDKEQNKTITYGKSMTKKFMTKVAKAYGADDPQYSLSLCDGETIISGAIKGDNYKMVIGDDTMVMALFADKDNVTMIVGSEDTKAYMVTPSDGSLNADAVAEEMESIDLDAIEATFPDSEKGKYFKIKYNEKIYYYEEFNGEGMLFTEGGTPVVIVEADAAYSVQFSSKVKDSTFDFTVPKGYEKVEE